MVNLDRIVVNDAKERNARFDYIDVTHISVFTIRKINYVSVVLNEASMIAVRNCLHRGSRSLDVDCKQVLTLKIQVEVHPQVLYPMYLLGASLLRNHSFHYQIQEG
jgi:hypothetical protein